MAVQGIKNSVQGFTDLLLTNQSPGSGQIVPVGSKALGTGNQGNGRVAEDTFTSSPQDITAPDAGIFQPGRSTRAQASANILFAPATGNTNQNEAAVQGGPALATNGVPAQAAGNGNSNSAANTTQTGATPAASADVQVQLQALNAALPALGLTNAEIQQIDRIASLVGDFNPGAYANIVNQFEALAQQAARQSPSPAVGSTAATTSAGTSGSGFQLKEILVQFTGSQATQNSASGNGGGSGPAANPAQNNPAGLQVTNVQFTLANGNGQTVQVQTQQQTTGATNPNQQTPQNLATAI